MHKQLLQALIILSFIPSTFAHQLAGQNTQLKSDSETTSAFAEAVDADTVDLKSLPEHESLDPAAEHETDVLESQGDVLQKDTPKYLQKLNQIDYVDIDGEAGGIPELQNDAIKRTQDEGTWGFQFMYISKANKSVQIMSQSRSHQQIKPASTLKLFTGWLAFLNGTYAKPQLNIMLRRSDNAMADQALRSVAKKMKPELKNPSELLDFGVNYMKKYYSTLEDGALFVPQNGSGLNDTQQDEDADLNKVTIRLETHLLQKILSSGKFDQFKILLARPGTDGTLKKRLKVTNSITKVYAKTGTLQHTKSLAGFLETKKGVIVFSIIGDKLKVSNINATQDIDDIVYQHAKYAIAHGM